MLSNTSFYIKSPQVFSHESENIPIIGTVPSINFIENVNIINDSFYVNNENKLKLVNNIKRIISKYHVSHNFVNELLLILKDE